MNAINGTLLLAVILLFQFPIHAQSAYQLYDDDGQKVNLGNVFEGIQTADVIIFGELHNNPICHWMEAEILQYLATDQRPVALGMEMFERDQQPVLTDLFNGIFSYKKLEQYTRTWSNYETDYRPLIKIAAKNNIPILATNVPRRYASYIFNEGLDSLRGLDVDQSLIPDLNFEVDTTLSSYAEILEMASQMPSHDKDNFLNAQAFKDVSMAEVLLSAKTSDNILYHINGAFHSINKEGICHYLIKSDPNLRLMTIQSSEVENPDEFQQQKNSKASFYLQIKSTMTKSYE